MPPSLAIHAPDRARLDALPRVLESCREGMPWLSELPPFSRLYFGVEFCQHLLPSPEDAGAAADLARERGWGLTLLTSYSTDAFVEKTLEFVRTAQDRMGADIEVVVNDWGLLRRLDSELGPDLELVLGRGLNRMMRDPRLPDVGPEHLGGDAPPETWQQGSMHSSGFRSLLARLGVSRVESDIPLQGLQPPVGDQLRTTVHAPWGMVASGRVCLVNAWGKPGSLRFVPPMHCDAPCRKFSIELRAPWARREGGAGQLPLVAEGSFIPLTRLLNRRRNALPEAEADPAPRFFQKGNTHFYRLDEAAMLRTLTWIEQSASVDRLVVAPDLPM